MDCKKTSGEGWKLCICYTGIGLLQIITQQKCIECILQEIYKRQSVTLGALMNFEGSLGCARAGLSVTI